MTVNSRYVNIKTIGYAFERVQRHGGILARKKTGDPLIITPQDDRVAAAANKRAFVAALESANMARFEGFLSDNIAPLVDIFPKIMGHIEERGDMSLAEMRAILQPALKKVPPDKLSKLDMQKIVRAKALTTPERVAEERQERERRIAEFRARRNQNFIGIFTDIGKGLGGMASILTGSTTLRATIPTALAAAMNLTIAPAAKAIGTVAAMSHIPRAFGYTASAGAIAVGIGGASLPLVDPAPYLPSMTTPEMMQEACVENPVALTSTANAVYVTADNITGDSDTHQLARSVMMHGAQHGVPAIALHYISYLETGKFSDTVANNSSASGFFQAIDATKIGYIKNHGGETFVYKEAMRKIEDGTATNGDRLLVTTFDTIAATSQDALTEALKTQKLDPIQLHALTLAADPYVQADLVGASMAQMVPEIMEEGLSSEEILELAAQYYTAYHFLGTTTFRKLNQMASENSQDPISIKFSRVVEGNPGLLAPDMTAAEALQSIQEKFIDYVENPARAFDVNYDASRSAVDFCLTEEAQKLFPEKITLAQAALYETGLHDEYSRAVDYASWGRDYAMAGWQKIQPATHDPAPAVTTPAGLVAELERAASPYAPVTSKRPLPRPADLARPADMQVAGLTTSAIPRARPTDLAK